MQIQSVIPEAHNVKEYSGPMATIIWAQRDDNELAQPYYYSHTYGLLRGPQNPHEWLPWNGGTLTEAIQHVISI